MKLRIHTVIKKPLAEAWGFFIGNGPLQFNHVRIKKVSCILIRKKDTHTIYVFSIHPDGG